MAEGNRTEAGGDVSHGFGEEWAFLSRAAIRQRAAPLTRAIPFLDESIGLPRDLFYAQHISSSNHNHPSLFSASVTPAFAFFKDKEWATTTAVSDNGPQACSTRFFSTSTPMTATCREVGVSTDQLTYTCINLFTSVFSEPCVKRQIWRSATLRRSGRSSCCPCFDFATSSVPQPLKKMTPIRISSPTASLMHTTG